ncbi:MAG TPA: response regulator [Bryobacteraceae bacterium]|jgi:hypothetical protein
MERTGFEQWKPREVARLLALVETERRYYQEMVAALPVALVVLASDRTIVSANRAFRHIVELRYEELRQKSIDQILPSPELTEKIRAAHVHNDTAPFFLNMGERRFRVAAVPIRSWEDEMEAETLLMLDDLSATGTITAAAPVRTPSLDPAGMPAVLWQADASTLSFTYVGGAAERLFGLPPTQWLASPHYFSKRIHPEDRADVMALFEAVAAAGGEATAEYRAISAIGAELWCRETIRVPAPDPDQAGQRIASGVLTAIAQRRQLESQSQTAAKIDSVRALSARLAHDLNNPLMIVTGYGEELLNALPESDPLRPDLTEMLSATGRVSELAGHLLAFTRPQAKSSTKLQLSSIVESADPEIWTQADPDQLREAIETLSSGAAHVSASTELIAEQLPGATLKPGAYAAIKIATATPPEPFDNFLPAKAATRAYLNVRQWSGDIFQSPQGFTLYLPLAEPEPEPETKPVEAAEPPPATILVVEDEPGIRALVRKILKRERYEVLEAGSAEEALEIASSHPARIDLLLTDVMLPAMSGNDLATALVQSRPDVKVLFVSGYTDDESIRSSGNFLAKPFTLGALLTKVHQALASMQPQA